MTWPTRLGTVLCLVAVLAAGCGDSGVDTVPPPTTLPPGTPTIPPLCPNGETMQARFDDVQAHVFLFAMNVWQPGRHDGVYTSARCWHDWTTDDCSAPLVGSTGLSFDFTHPCHRHDFGYRNFKRIRDEFAVDAWNALTKRSTDNSFRRDMRNHCATRPVWLKAQCYNWSAVFYEAVRLFGT